MNKKTVVGFIVVAMLVAGWFGVRAYVGKRAEEVLITAALMGRDTPTDVGLSYSSFTIPSGNRALESWLVRAPDSIQPQTAILVFHGNRTSISHLVGLQLELYENGITSMVFDYSGFGNSNGTPSVGRLREDAVSAFGVFVDSVGRTSRKFVLGTSLGAAVLMDAIQDIQLGVDGVILVGTFASSRATAVRQGKVPKIMSLVLKNHYDNVKAARELRKPLLVVHSESDELFPMSDAEAVVAAAGGPAQLVRLSGVLHDSYLTRESHWQPVLDFIRTSSGATPPAAGR